MGRAYRQSRATIALAILLACYPCARALDPTLDINQYGHTAWTGRDGFSMGNIYAMAQTPDGYLWLGTEFGLFRFDGVRGIRWQPPAGQHLPDDNINSLLVTRDGTLWIGTFSGLVTWDGVKLNWRPEPELRRQFVASLYEDREGTVWAGTLGTPTGRLCAIRSGGTQCYGQDGAFGRAVWALYEDSAGDLWAAAQSGLWRMKPGPPRRYPTSTELIGLSKADNGRLLVAMHGSGLMQLVGDKVESYPIRSPINSNRLLQDRDVDANRLVRDRDGGLWIGTVERGLIHVHDGRTDVFSRADGLSGDVILSIFEDREGDIWVASTGGLDRFRELAVATISVKQGLSSDATQSVLAATDGSIWVGAHQGLTRWKNGQATTFGAANGLPDDAPQSLFQDDLGRIWVSTSHGLAYFQGGRFRVVTRVPGGNVHYITGDKAGNLWLSEQESLMHLVDGRLVELIPWSQLGPDEIAEVLLPDREPGGLWLGFWAGGRVSYFKDGQIRRSYTAADGLGEGNVPDLQLDSHGALWAATQDGGLSRLKDGRIVTLTTRNGLPCNAIHWVIEDDDGSFWLYTACGLVRISRTEMDAWIADPKHRVQTTVWDATDGVRLRSSAASAYGPRVTKSTGGKLWFVTGEGVQIVDPRHLPFNKLPPPVHIEQVTADGKIYDVSSLGMAGFRLPPLVRDLEIDYTALSLVAPEKDIFRYKLEGVDSDWKNAGNRRQAFYTNLPPGRYRFRVIASNNSGVWNEQGASLDFSIAPTYYQTTWFRALCVAAIFALLCAAYFMRVRQLRRQELKLRDVIETIPTFAWTALPNGTVDFVNRHWQEYTGLSIEMTASLGWKAAVHPADLKWHADKWRVSVATGETFENEVRFRRAVDGQYRWFLTRAVPLRDHHRDKILKWYGTSTDIEDRKRAEQLQADLAHMNRVTTLGELTASLAHELKQPLTATVMNASACLRWLKRDQPDLERACAATSRIVEDGKRAGDVIERLRSLYKNSPPKRELVEVNEIVREMVVLLRGEANRYAVSIRTDLAAALPEITVDRVQLQQVLMNLMLNGIEAMKDTGGVLMVMSQLGQGGKLLISVCDTGVGLPMEEADQIFKAFFTTKAQGSGMGLAISRSIVESHGGRLWATANEGRGSTFHFALPIVAEDMKVPVAET